MGMTFKYKPSIEDLNERLKGNLGEALGIEITALGDDYLKARMPIDHRTTQPMGLLHGGASAALAETLGSLGSLLYIDTPNTYPVGIEINANHLKSATAGFVTGTAKAIRVGRNVHVWNIDITNENDQLICVSRLTVMIINK